jgi:TRAP-type C4-dicarboxylate transport system permease small subunit
MAGDFRAGLRRLDAGVAKVEGVIVVALLLSMVLVASAQALAFNVAQRGVESAQAALDALSWADVFLQKGTLWLAFLGASLATHGDRHISLDLLPRLVAPRLRAALRAFASLGAGLAALALAVAFHQACRVADMAVPFDYEVLGAAGPLHVCDATAADLSGSQRPALVCALRAALASVGVEVSSGAGIAQLIAPLTLIVIALRLLARSLAAARVAWHEPPASPPSAAGSERAPEQAP